MSAAPSPLLSVALLGGLGLAAGCIIVLDRT